MAWKRFLAITFFTLQVFLSPRSTHARYYDPDVGRFTSADTIVPSAMDPQSLNRYAYVRNNPAVLTDPSGHSWLSKGIRHVSNQFNEHFVRNALILQTIDVFSGSAVLASRREGQAVLAGQAIAAASFGFGGTSVGWGAVSGSASSAYSARRSGKNMMWAVIRGGLEGAAVSATFAGISGTKTHWVYKALGKSAISAGLTKMHGGDSGSVWMAAGISFAAEAANSYFTKTVGYGADPTPGTELESADRSYKTVKPPQGKNVIGFNGGPPSIGRQGATLSRLGNMVPGGNAVAQFHDSLIADFPALEPQPWNAFSIIPSIPMAYVAQLGVSFSPLITSFAGENSGH